MRIKITCDVGEGIRLPINYNYFLTGVIYQVLKESDPECADFLRKFWSLVCSLPTEGSAYVLIKRLLETIPRILSPDF